MSVDDVDRSDPAGRAWVDEAVRLVEADANRSADTHLVRFPLPEFPTVDLYLKDESTHPSGSLKHRLARSLFLYALCNGQIGPDTCVTEASSGSTAVSEAYFAAMIGVPFVAVVPRSTSPAKIALIERQGGRCHLVDDPATVHDVAAQIAADCNGHYLDQFSNAAVATDWRGNNNIAESVFEQMRLERHPVPAWVVVGAGTGGTSATIGRFLRYRRLATRLAVVDPEGSAFFPGWRDRDPAARGEPSRIEGIGRPRVELSFVPGVVDRMIRVPDTASFVHARWASVRLGRKVGASTGTNLVGALRVVREVAAAGGGSVVTLLCDGGERYVDTVPDDGWWAERDAATGGGLTAADADLEASLTPTP